MRSSTAWVTSTGESERSRKRTSSSVALRSCKAVMARSLPDKRGEVVGGDRRAAPQALQALVGDRELRQLEQVGVHAVGRELALDVAEQLHSALGIGGRVVGRQGGGVGLRVVAGGIGRVGVTIEVERVGVGGHGQVEIALERA